MAKHKNIRSALKAAKETGLRQKVGPQVVERITVSCNVRFELHILNWLKAEGAKNGQTYQEFLNSFLIEEIAKRQYSE